jgi:hypothetical protein
MSAAFSSAVAKFQRVDAEGQGDIRDKKGSDNMAVEAVKVLSFSEENLMGAPREGGLVQIDSLLSPTADAG